jgi:hypothetical protein
MGDIGDKPVDKSAIVSSVAGFTYFNRPGATLDQQRADLEGCRTSVLPLAQPARNSTMSSVGNLYGVTGIIVSSMMDAGAQHGATLRAAPINYEDCMVVHGWRVVQLDEAVGRDLDRRPTTWLSTHLATMVGEEAPQGAVARTFANELNDQGTELFTTVPPPRSVSLSLKLFSRAESTAEYRQRQAAVRAAHEAFVGHEGRPVDATKASELALLPLDTTVIVVRVFGNVFASAPILVRADAQPSSGADAIVATLTAAPPQNSAPQDPRNAEPQDQTYVYVVPPGHWRLSGFTNEAAQPTTLCLGAPAFDVAAGEAVFAGSFGFGGTGPRLGLSLDPPRAALAAAPALAERMRAAAYTNGETFPCGGGASYLYVLEVEGAPFRHDYAFGSRVATSTRSAVAPVQ